MTNANASSVQLNVISGRREPLRERRHQERAPQKARTAPSSAAMSARETLSVSSCRTRRPAPAPSALRTASSRWRAMPLASTRLPTLRAPDQQHEHAGPEEHEERRAHGSDRHVLERHDVHAPAFIRVGERLLQPRGDRVELLLGGGGRHAGFQASDSADVAATAARTLGHGHDARPCRWNGGNWKPGGSTPMTEWLTSLRRMVLPRMRGSLP